MPPQPPAQPPADAEALERLARRFLVHCFLYYRLNEAVISDEEFDALAESLRAVHEAHSDKELPFADILAPALGPEASGFAIRNYPHDIITDAFKLLYAVNRPSEDFEEFVHRRGYVVEGS